MAITVSTIKMRLETKRGELREELNHLTEAFPPAVPVETGNRETQEWGEVSVEVNEAATERAIRASLETLLGEVEAALARIEAGTYGMCVACHQPITPKRLEILPWAARDVTCQEHVEGKNHADAAVLIGPQPTHV